LSMFFGSRFGFCPLQFHSVFAHHGSFTATDTVGLLLQLPAQDVDPATPATPAGRIAIQSHLADSPTAALADRYAEGMA